MTDEEKAELIALCERIAVEKDPQMFHALTVQLHDLLQREDPRLQAQPRRESP